METADTKPQGIVLCTDGLAAVRERREIWKKQMPDPQCYPAGWERMRGRIAELDWLEKWFEEKAANPKLTRWRGRNQKLKGPLPMKNEKQTESQTASQGAAHGSRLVLQRRYLPASHMPKTWTEWHDHPEPQQIAWGPGSYVTLEENMKTACEGFYARGQGCEFRMVRRMNETLWEYSANK